MDPVQQRSNDARFLSQTIETMENVSRIREGAHYAGNRLFSTRAFGMVRPIKNAVDAFSILSANKQDIASGDRFRPRTAKVVGAVAGSSALAWAAGVSLGAVSIGAAPAIVLTAGAGLAGAAIGTIAAEGYLWAREKIASW